MFKRLLMDEQGDLIQNIIILLGGILCGVALTNTMLGVIKTKVAAEGASLGIIP